MKVSIIVPCWGVERYLDCCLESLVGQTLKDIEIVLVDDESPDRVPEMCEEWARKDSRIKVIHKKNAGLGMACNSGIEVATGDYIAFCDSDDWVDAEMYETMYNAAVKYQADMVFTGLKRVDMDGNPCGTLPHRKETQFFQEREEINKLACDMIASSPHVRYEHTIQMSAKVVLYRRQVIEHNHIQFVSEREIPSEDLHFNLNVLSKSNKVCILPLSFYNYRVNTSSITKKSKFGMYSNVIKRYEYTLKECEELRIGNDFELRCQRMLLAYTRLHICSIIASVASQKDKKKEINEVCCHPILNNVINNYPVYKMPFVHRVFVYAIKYRSYFFLRILSNIKR